MSEEVQAWLGMGAIFAALYVWVWKITGSLRDSWPTALPVIAVFSVIGPGSILLYHFVGGFFTPELF